MECAYHREVIKAAATHRIHLFLMASLTGTPLPGLKL
jgi:hypothetical protein